MKKFDYAGACIFAVGILLVALILFAGHPHFALAVTLLPTTALQKVNLMSEEAWATNQRNTENMVQADSLRAQIEKQNALGGNFIQKITDARKDNIDVRILWVDFCGEAAADCNGADNYCAGIDANEAGIDFKDYNITSCITDGFKANEDTFAGSFMDFQDYIVKNQNQKITNLLNLLNKKYILFLHANAGINRGLQGGRTFNVSNQTEVVAADYDNTDLITDIIIDAKMSKIINPFMIDGKNLMKTFLNADFDALNLDGKGDAARKAFFDYTADPFGFSDAGLPNSTFMITPYAAAFVNKNYYNNAAPQYDPDVKMEKYRIRIPSFGISVDVLHQRTCVNLKKDRFAHVWRYTLNYDFLLNPNGCLINAKRATGILEYTKV